MNIEIFTRNESVKFLGHKISFYQHETTEIKSRIRAAWATFHKYRQELTSKNYMLKRRLRLFDATVSPTVCYAAGPWAPNKEHERMIQSTQRKMLRLIIQTKRKYKKIVKQKIAWQQSRKQWWKRRLGTSGGLENQARGVDICWRHEEKRKSKSKVADEKADADTKETAKDDSGCQGCNENAKDLLGSCAGR